MASQRGILEEFQDSLSTYINYQSSHQIQLTDDFNNTFVVLKCKNLFIKELVHLCIVLSTLEYDNTDDLVSLSFKYCAVITQFFDDGHSILTIFDHEQFTRILEQGEDVDRLSRRVISLMKALVFEYYQIAFAREILLGKNQAIEMFTYALDNNKYMDEHSRDDTFDNILMYLPSDEHIFDQILLQRNIQNDGQTAVQLLSRYALQDPWLYAYTITDNDAYFDYEQSEFPDAFFNAVRGRIHFPFSMEESTQLQALKERHKLFSAQFGEDVLKNKTNASKFFVEKVDKEAIRFFKHIVTSRFPQHTCLIDRDIWEFCVVISGIFDINLQTVSTRVKLRNTAVSSEYHKQLEDMYNDFIHSSIAALWMCRVWKCLLCIANNDDNDRFTSDVVNDAFKWIFFFVTDNSRVRSGICDKIRKGRLDAMMFTTSAEYNTDTNYRAGYNTLFEENTVHGAKAILIKLSSIDNFTSFKDDDFIMEQILCALVHITNLNITIDDIDLEPIPRDTLKSLCRQYFEMSMESLNFTSPVVNDVIFDSTAFNMDRFRLLPSECYSPKRALMVSINDRLIETFYEFRVISTAYEPPIQLPSHLYTCVTFDWNKLNDSVPKVNDNLKPKDLRYIESDVNIEQIINHDIDSMSDKFLQYNHILSRTVHYPGTFEDKEDADFYIEKYKDFVFLVIGFFINSFGSHYILNEGYKEFYEAFNEEFNETPVVDILLTINDPSVVNCGYVDVNETFNGSHLLLYFKSLWEGYEDQDDLHGLDYVIRACKRDIRRKEDTEALLLSIDTASSLDELHSTVPLERIHGIFTLDEEDRLDLGQGATFYADELQHANTSDNSVLGFFELNQLKLSQENLTLREEFRMLDAIISKYKERSNALQHAMSEEFVAQSSQEFSDRIRAANSTPARLLALNSFLGAITRKNGLVPINEDTTVLSAIQYVQDHLYKTELADKPAVIDIINAEYLYFSFYEELDDFIAFLKAKLSEGSVQDLHELRSKLPRQMQDILVHTVVNDKGSEIEAYMKFKDKSIWDTDYLPPIPAAFYDVLDTWKSSNNEVSVRETLETMKEYYRTIPTDYDLRFFVRELYKHFPDLIKNVNPDNWEVVGDAFFVTLIRTDVGIFDPRRKLLEAFIKWFQQNIYTVRQRIDLIFNETSTDRPVLEFIGDVNNTLGANILTVDPEGNDTLYSILHISLTNKEFPYFALRAKELLRRLDAEVCELLDRATIMLSGIQSLQTEAALRNIYNVVVSNKLGLLNVKKVPFVYFREHPDLIPAIILGSHYFNKVLSSHTQKKVRDFLRVFVIKLPYLQRPKESPPPPKPGVYTTYWRHDAKRARTGDTYRNPFYEANKARKEANRAQSRRSFRSARRQERQQRRNRPRTPPPKRTNNRSRQEKKTEGGNNRRRKRTPSPQARNNKSTASPKSSERPFNIRGNDDLDQILVAVIADLDNTTKGVCSVARTKRILDSFTKNKWKFLTDEQKDYVREKGLTMSKKLALKHHSDKFSSTSEDVVQVHLIAFQAAMDLRDLLRILK